jgi:hypothetical protein
MAVGNALNAKAALRELGVRGLGRAHVSVFLAAGAAVAASLAVAPFAPANKYAALAVIAGAVAATYGAALAALGLPAEDKRTALALLARFRSSRKTEPRLLDVGVTKPHVDHTPDAR